LVLTPWQLLFLANLLQYTAMIIKTAEIITVGTELLLGEVIDSNSSYLANELADRGVDVYWSLRVGDNLERIVSAIKQAVKRSDLLILTGGLGPTDDDMTREAIATAVNEQPYVDKKLEEILRNRFAKFSRKMPKQNLKQAWMINSATSLNNPIGTAPGWLLNKKFEGTKAIIISLPGPPREMKRMWTQEAAPRLEFDTAALFSKTFKLNSFKESAIAESLGELTKQYNPSVATYARRDGIQVRVASKAHNLTAAKELAQDSIEKVEEILKNDIWGYDNDNLASLICNKLSKKNLKLATFESISGGKLANELNSVSDVSQTHIISMVGYKLQVLAAFGISDNFELEQNGSKTMTASMAKAVAKFFNADIGLAINGEISPDETEIMVSIYDGSEDYVKKIRLPRLERAWIQERAAFAALSLLNKKL